MTNMTLTKNTRRNQNQEEEKFKHPEKIFIPKIIFQKSN